MKKFERLGISKIVIASAVLLGMNFASPVYAARGDKGAADEYYQDAKKYVQKGDTNAAVIQLKNALQEDRNHIGARKLLGEVYLKVGNGPAAEKELKAAQRGGANDIDIQIQIARAYVLQGKFDQILKELKDEVAGSTVRAKILDLRGQAFFGLGMSKDAFQTFEEAVRLQPDNAKIQIGLARVFVSIGNASSDRNASAAVPWLICPISANVIGFPADQNLTDAVRPEHNPGGLNQDNQIKEKAIVLDIVEVVLELLLGVLDGCAIGVI